MYYTSFAHLQDNKTADVRIVKFFNLNVYVVNKYLENTLLESKQEKEKIKTNPICVKTNASKIE